MANGLACALIHFQLHVNAANTMHSGRYVSLPGFILYGNKYTQNRSNKETV